MSPHKRAAHASVDIFEHSAEALTQYSLLFIHREEPAQTRKTIQWLKWQRLKCFNSKEAEPGSSTYICWRDDDNNWKRDINWA